MKYESTRGKSKKAVSTEAIIRGIASDGGLYVPTKLIHVDYFNYIDLTYQQRAFNIFKQFLSDYEDQEIIECIENAYNLDNFDSKDIVKIVDLNSNMSILELWHGPTYAFKDIALQILPYFLTKAIVKTDEKKEILILVATSGDTGKAALEGFKNVDNTDIVVFFPKDGVSEIQELQMVTQEGDNLTVIKVEGNFDDTQSGVKSIFLDEDIRSIASEKNYIFSSANSINWGRLLPQIVYYISAYSDMVKKGTIEDGEKINICVPTGNFGNILAAYYAKIMGLPVNKLICASNKNNILTEFLSTGTYDINRDIYKTISPSMDILISSNLERLLFDLTGRDSKMVSKWMEDLKTKGSYTVDEKTKKKLDSIFFAGYCNDEETKGTIENIYNEFGYLVDTHTAVAIDVYDKYIISTQDMSKSLITSTASPFKFASSVIKAIKGDESIENKTEMELLEMLSEESGLKIPDNLSSLNKKDILHHHVVKTDDMEKIIIEHIAKRREKEQK